MSPKRTAFRTDIGRSLARPAAFAALVGCVVILLWAPVSIARIGFDDVGYRLLEAWSYCAYGLRELAHPIFRDVASAYPRAAEALVALGLLSDAEGRTRTALKRYGEAADASPDMAAALLTLQGDVYLRSGRAAAAVAHYRESLRLDDALARSHYGLGVATEMLGRAGQWPPSVEPDGRVPVAANWRSEAIGRHRKALEQAPDLVDGHVRLARLLIESAGDEPDASSEELTEALNHLNRARLLDERNPEVHLLMGRAYERTGQTAEARHAFRRARQLAGGEADTPAQP